MFSLFLYGKHFRFCLPQLFPTNHGEFIFSYPAQYTIWNAQRQYFLTSKLSDKYLMGNRGKLRQHKRTVTRRDKKRVTNVLAHIILKLLNFSTRGTTNTWRLVPIALHDLGSKQLSLYLSLNGFQTCQLFTFATHFSFTTYFWGNCCVTCNNKCSVIYLRVPQSWHYWYFGPDNTLCAL